MLEDRVAAALQNRKLQEEREKREVQRIFGGEDEA